MAHFDELASNNFGDIRYMNITDKLSASTEVVPDLHIKGVKEKSLYQNTITFSSAAIKRANKNADIQSITGFVCQSGVTITNITSVQQNGNKYEITVTNNSQRDKLIDSGFKMGGLSINCTNPKDKGITMTVVGVPPEVDKRDLLPFFQYYGTVRTFYDVVKPVFFGGKTNQIKNGIYH